MVLKLVYYTRNILTWRPLNPWQDKYSSTMSSIFLFISWRHLFWWKLQCQGDFSFIGWVIGKVICHLIGLRCRSLRGQIFAPNQPASHFHTTSAGNLYRFMAPLYYHINIFFNAGRSLVHNCTIFFCSLDVRNDQCRGPSIKEKDHLAGYLREAVKNVLTDFFR